MLRTRPLFTLDPGWLFLAAGLAMFVAITLIPAHRDAHQLREQLAQIRSEEQYAYERLRAYTAFLDEMDDPDPAMLRRLAATQLNMIPRGEQPVIISTSQVETVTGWVDNSVRFEPHEPTPLPETMLSNLAEGRLRIWLVGGAVLAMFMGLLLTPGLTRTRPERRARGSERKTARASLVAATVVDEDAEAELAVQIAHDDVEESLSDPIRKHAEVRDLGETDESSAVIDVVPCDDDEPLDLAPGEQSRFRWMDSAAVARLDAPEPEDMEEDHAAPADSLIRQLKEPRLPFAPEKLEGSVETKPDATQPEAGFDQLKAMIRAEVAIETTGRATTETDEETACEEADDSALAESAADEDDNVSLLDDAEDTDDWQWQEAPPEEGASSPVAEVEVEDDATLDDEAEMEDAIDVEEADADLEDADASEDLVEDEIADADVDLDEEADLEDDHEQEVDEEYEDDDQEDDEEDGEFVYEYYDEDGNLIDPDDLDDEEWEFVDAEEEEEDEEADDTP